MTLAEQAERMAERFDVLAEIGDMGRKPDPTDYRRQAAALLRQCAEALRKEGV